MNCNEGIAFARALPDVAVRDQVSKFSADLAQQLRDILDNTAVGHLTPPEQTAEGIQMFAICAKKETKSDTPEMRRNSRSNASAEIRRAGQALSREFAARGDDRIQDSPKIKTNRRQEAKLVQPLALTLGEPAGIGPDLALAVWHRRAELDIAAFLYRSPIRIFCAAGAAAARDLTFRSRLSTPAAAAAAFSSALPVVPLDVAASAAPGHPDRSSAPAAIASIRRAVSPTSWPAQPPPSSPIRWRRTCCTIRDLPNPATPNFWRRWCRKRPEKRCGR